MSDMEMTDLGGPLTCIECARQAEPMSDDAEGWVAVQRSVDEGDDHDDMQWKCPGCATASDDYYGDPTRRVAQALGLYDHDDGP